MLQTAEIQQRFSQIQQTINQAEEVTRNDQGAPSEIRDCIQKIAREMPNAQRVMQSNDQSRMVECIDKLEEMGDDAKRLCRSAQPSPQVASVVTRVHDVLSDLKHQLH
ncbi:hypothetical protein [Massilia yuzhufengensis]|uniref:Uncharacterized protein n=1 Tax=Massilia yuzhufengensis TaxID=1164594 RepID=A0A1I1T7E6_9BURK|nr:hypothetical protein [Massilia yuzhufengensis]SFD54512.1 hypothetical protein SAMN05216204_12822 [Massilia yuzhufengensis]